MVGNIQPDEIRKEPMAVIDITGSMQESVAPGSMLSKAALLEQIMMILARDLGDEDSQGEDEESGGGLYTVWFANGVADEIGFDRPASPGHKAFAKGDLNSGNFQEFWRSLNWGGGTYIKPALDTIDEHFQEEFGHLPDAVQPEMALAIITDGKLGDANYASAWLRQRSGKSHVLVVVLGSDDAHHQAVTSWQTIAQQNTHVRVIDANASTDAHGIASELLAMLS